MISFGCNIKAKHNFKNINTIIKNLPQTNTGMLKDILKNIRGYAIRLEKGHNEEGILCELVDTSTNEVKGRVYTDKNNMPYAMFEHFGTGQYAEMEHVGTTAHFIESGYAQWFIPVNKVPKALHYPIITINDAQFYVARGAKANHFMTDAEFESRQENGEIAKKQFEEMLKEACK